MIKPMDYIKVRADKRMKESGLVRGDVLLVTGLKPAPVSKQDPYLQRVYILTIKVDKNGYHEVPNDENEFRVYLIDPRNVDLVGEKESEELAALLVKQYGG